MTCLVIMLLFLGLCLAPSFVISLIATWVVRCNAHRWGLVDQPGDRKIHVTPTPLGGGIGIWLGVMIPLAAAQGIAWWFTRLDAFPGWIPTELAIHVDGVVHRSSTLWIVLGAGTILAALGLVDDLRNLPWRPRLAIQVIVTVGIVASGIRGTIFVANPWVGGTVTALWILVLVNSFNFLDNMDALSSGIAMVASLMFAAVLLTSTGEPRWLVSGVLLILAGSLGGFLCFNKPPASIFMGDSGSYFIGLLLATMTIAGTWYDYQGSRHVILTPLCILAVPLYDFCSVIVIRLKEGRSPFHGDKSHFSHRLVQLGLSQSHAVLTIHLATFATGLGALLLYQVPSWTGALMVVSLIASVLAIIAILETVGRRGRGED